MSALAIVERPAKGEPTKLPVPVLIRIEAATRWHAASTRVDDAIKASPQPRSDAKARNGLARIADCLSQIRRTLDTDAPLAPVMEKLADAVDRVPPRAFAGGDDMFFVCWLSLYLARCGGEAVEITGRLADLDARMALDGGAVYHRVLPYFQRATERDRAKWNKGS